jgi:hypothetical protein
MNRHLTILMFLPLATVFGCQGSDKPIYANVKGTVTYNGKPIDKGQITFAVEGRPPSTMDIVDGKFSGQAMVGSNRISVSAKRKTANPPKLNKDAQNQIAGYMKVRGQNGEFGGPPIDYDPSMVEYIPPEWNTQTKQIRVVETGATNEFDFDIKGS